MGIHVVNAYNPYEVGDRPVFEFYITDDDDLPADPTAMSIIIKRPRSGVETPYSFPHAAIDNPAVGTYIFTLPVSVDIGGSWKGRIEATSGIVNAEEWAFWVSHSHFT